MRNLSIALALVLGMSTSALALEGLDGDGNPVPGVSNAYATHAVETTRQAAWSVDRAFASAIQTDSGTAPALDSDGNPVPGAR